MAGARPITRGERPEQNRASGGEKKGALLGVGFSRQLDCGVDGAEWPWGVLAKQGSLVPAWRDCPALQKKVREKSEKRGKPLVA